MTVHELKVWPQYYEAILDGRKRFELRWDDRGFRVGDILRLHSWDPETKAYTVQEIGPFSKCPVLRARVTYLAKGPLFGLLDGYVVMSLDDVDEEC